MASSTSIAPSVIAGLSSIFLHSSATTTAGSSYITKPTRIPPFSSSSAAGSFLSVRPCLHHFNSLIAITQHNRLLIRTNTSTSNDNTNAGLHPPPPSLIATSNSIFSDEEDADVRYDSSQTDPTSGKVEHHQLDRSKMGSDNPLQIDSVVDQEKWVAKGIKIYAISATATAKRTVVSNLVAVCAKGRKTIVFSQTKRVACEVSLALTYSIACEAFHGDISQQQRERIMNDFRQGKFPLLVTTDITSRGLDMPNVDLVTYYELPKDSETFVHRSSHTGCAGKEGTSFVMVTCSQKRKVRSLESDVEWKFDFVSRQAIGEVLQPLAGQEVAPLSGVFPESVDFSTPTTQKLIGGQGTTARAAVVTHSRKKKPNAKVFALGQHISISAHKAHRVIDEIRGRSYEEALMKLGLMPYSACHPIFKLVYSAAANASHSMGSNKANLVVRRAEVDEGTTLKKIKPQSPGRSCAVKRRTCHITIILEDVCK